MAATHYLDVSLTLDDIAWHFLNVGEPRHVDETEAGLRQLGLEELADLFHETYELMQPYIPEMCGSGERLYERFERDGKDAAFGEITNKMALLDRGAPKVSGSLIFGSWVRYARKNPELVFDA